jgi:hypothetical protein
MYLQNVLVAIATEISNKVRYSLFYKYIARSNILSMQASYDESQARSDVGYAEDKPKTTAKEYGN